MKADAYRTVEILGGCSGNKIYEQNCRKNVCVSSGGKPEYLTVGNGIGH